MPHQLSFETRFAYNSLADGITIEVALSLGNTTTVSQAKVDTGAQVCLFQREVADELGIEVTSGSASLSAHWWVRCAPTATR